MTPGVMRREAQKYLFDIRRAAGDLVNFTTGKMREHYLADPVLRAAVERKFEILGEAAGQLAKLDATLAEQIPDYRRLVAFRNVLIHGYADVDDELVWDLLQTRLPDLVQAVEKLR